MHQCPSMSAVHFHSQESQGKSYPEQEAVEPLPTRLSASGSPVATIATVDGNHAWVKMEATNGVTGNGLPILLPSGSSMPVGSVETTMAGPSQHLQSGTLLVSTAAASTTATTSEDFNLPSDQPRLQALLQSAGAQNKTRHKPPTVRELLPATTVPAVRELLPATTAPQTLQQTIIIKPPPIVRAVNAQGTLPDQGGFVSSQQAFQAVQALQEGQSYFIQSLPVLTQPAVTSVAHAVGVPAPVPPAIVASEIGPLRAPPSADVSTTATLQAVIPQTQQAVPPAQPGTPQTPLASNARPFPASPLPADTDPLTVLSATAAKKKPLPVPSPNIDTPAQRPQPSMPPPASQLHVIQPASGHHEAMDTTAAPAETTAPVQPEEEDWDPFLELRLQCNKKLKFLETRRMVDETVCGRLKIIKGELVHVQSV